MIYQLNENEDLTFHPIKNEAGGRLILGQMKHRVYGNLTRVRIEKTELENKFQLWRSKTTTVHGAPA